MMKLKIIKHDGEIIETDEIERFVLVSPNLIRTYGHYKNGDECEYKYDFATAEITETSVVPNQKTPEAKE